MKVQILGTGVLWKSNKATQMRKPPLVAIDHPDFLLLFDCSQGTYERLVEHGYDFSKPIFLCISHVHVDHFAGFVPLYVALFMEKIDNNVECPGVTVIAPQQVIDAIPKLLEIFLPDVENHQFDHPKVKLVSGMQSGESYVIKGDSNEHNSVSITVYEMFHGFGKCQTFGFCLHYGDFKLGYTGDTGRTTNLNLLMRNVDVCICELSSKEGSEEFASQYGHLTPKMAAHYAKHNKVKNLIATHYPHDVEPHLLASQISSHLQTLGHVKVYIARDGNSFSVCEKGYFHLDSSWF